jgi:hypothetical protein
MNAPASLHSARRFHLQRFPGAGRPRRGVNIDETDGGSIDVEAAHTVFKSNFEEGFDMDPRMLFARLSIRGGFPVRINERNTESGHTVRLSLVDNFFSDFDTV